METIEIVRSFKFDSAHMLDGHKGLCANLHGHCYHMNVILATTGSLVNDMVIDFQKIKQVVDSEVVNLFDHAVILNTASADPFERQLIELAKKYNKKCVLMSERATAENMSKLIYEVLSRIMDNDNFYVKGIELWETENCYVKHYCTR